MNANLNCQGFNLSQFACVIPFISWQIDLFCINKGSVLYYGIAVHV